MKDLRKHRSILACLCLALTGITAAWAQPEEPTNGQISTHAGTALVWNARTLAWIEPESFWLDYVGNYEGRFLGRSNDYPAYADAQEHDTLLIDADGGPCLMYFFHERWRRAQDVRRWDPQFNALLGCPRVFD